MKKRLLVLGVAPQELGGSYFNGVTTVIRYLTPHFVSKYDVALFATNVRKKNNNKLIKWENNVSIQIFGYSYLKLVRLVLKNIMRNPINTFNEMKAYKKVYGMNPIRTLLYRVNLDEIIKYYDPQIIHAHGVHFSVILKYIKHNITVVTTFHDIPLYNPEAREINLKKGIEIEKLYTKSAKLIYNFTCLNHAKLNTVNTLLDIKKTNYRIISNGINLEKFKFVNEERLNTRNMYNINEKEIVFLTVASLTKRKGHERFLNYMYKHNLNIRYWIVGNGPEYNNLENKIKDLRLDDKVKLLGPIPNDVLYKYYSAADCFVLPSSSEGQAMCILEALACGLNICLDQKIIDTLELGDDLIHNIFSIDLENYLFNSSICKIKHDIENRIKISDSMKRYSWDNIAKEYIDFFEKVLLR